MNLYRLWTIAVADLRLSLSSPGVIVSRVLVPLALIVIIGFANGAFDPEGGAVPTYDVVVLDRDGSRSSELFVSRLKQADEQLDVELLDADGAAAFQSRVAEREAYAGVEVASGFAEALAEGAATSVILHVRDQGDDGVQRLSSTVSRVGSETVGILSAERWARAVAEEVPAVDDGYPSRVRELAAARWGENPTEIASTTVEPVQPERALRSWGGGFQQSVPGMGSMYALFAILAGVSTLIWERRHGTLQRIITTPARPREVIGGKVLSRMLVGLMQFAVAFAAGAVIGRIAGIAFGASPLGIALVAVAFSFVGSALTLLLATLVQTSRQAGGATTFIALTLAPLGGAWWSLDLEFIPDFMRLLARVSPFYWAMEGFKSVIMYSGGVVDVLGYVGVLVGIGVVLFVIAVLRFRLRG